MSTEHEKLQEVIEKFDTAMLVTQETTGALVARPMAIAEHDQEAGTLMFSTSSESGKVIEIQVDEEVAVVMQSSSRYISLSGKAKYPMIGKKYDRCSGRTGKSGSPKALNSQICG